MDFIYVVFIIGAIIAIIWVVLDHRMKVIDSLQEDRDKLSKKNLELLESIQRSQQAQADQLNELSRSMINFQSTVDSKLKAQSDEFKKDLTKVNHKVDTLLGLVMECDSDTCPTKRKVSEYLKNQSKLD